jgi:predicted nucleotidyltransferase
MVPTGVILDPASEDLVVTFGGLFEKTKFISQIRKVLTALKEKLASPVDVEFASDGKRLFILQCRPQSQTMLSQKVTVPEDIPNDRRFFSASKYVTTGMLQGIEYIVYVDPEAYDGLETREGMIAVARAVGDLNFRLPRRKFILMGPGRWGSRGDIKLGVPVQYRDINNTCLLVEIAKKKGGYLPELSFGTHFFQDLVEANIQYLPLYPDERDNLLNERFLLFPPNRMSDVLINHRQLENVVRLIKVDDLIPGGSLRIAMDGEHNKALAYLQPPDHANWRLQKVEEIAQDIDPERFGVVALYVIGSAKESSAGPGSDLDLLVHVRQTPEQREDLKAWFERWSKRLAEENRERTGIDIPGFLDIHLITDQDIKDKTSWAVHIGALYNSAREVALPKKKVSG